MFYPLCACGCGQEVMREGEKFLIGHGRQMAEMRVDEPTVEAKLEEAAVEAAPAVVVLEEKEPQPVAMVVAPPQPTVSVEGPEVHIVAQNQPEMAAAAHRMADWFGQKVVELKAECREVKKALDHAKEHKWATGTLANQLRRAMGRRDFYVKAKAAVEAGYTIIPNIPVDLFALRVDRKTPQGGARTLDTEQDWERAVLPEQKSDLLELGEGHYESSEITVSHTSRYLADGKTMRKTTKPVAYRELVFPVIAARPQVMSATQEAMSLKIFDEIGISPARKSTPTRPMPYVPQGDPMIVGRIRQRKEGYREGKTLSFLIAWHIDLRTL